MSESTTKDSAAAKHGSEEEGEVRRNGFLGRLVRKLDDSMKRKADERAGEGCCGGDDKGGTCC